MKEFLQVPFLFILFVQSAIAFQSKDFISRSCALPTTTVSLPATSSTTTTTAATSTTTSGTEKKSKKVSVLLCPAQFCVPADYEEFFENLKSTRSVRIQAGDKHLPEIGTCRVAPLPRTEWIKVARQLPTRKFLEAKLDAKTTLGWYFDAIESALADIYANEGSDTNICIIGHSIGGWVARGYLGGLAR